MLPFDVPSRFRISISCCTKAAASAPATPSDVGFFCFFFDWGFFGGDLDLDLFLQLLVIFRGYSFRRMVCCVGETTSWLMS
jgi:hypothetical protein